MALLEGDAAAYRWESADLREALGHYYLAKLEEQAGHVEQAESHLQQARLIEPMIERRAIIVAQRAYARADQ